MYSVRFGLVAFLCVAAFGAGPTAMPQTVDTFSRAELEALEEEKASAERELAALQAAESSAELDVSQLNSALLSAAAESRRREEQATKAERDLIDLEIRRRDATKSLFADETALEELLAALASAARSKPPAMIVSPDKANVSIRSAILMSDAAPELAARADMLSEEISELSRLERGIRRERARLEAAEATLAFRWAEIEKLAAAKRLQYEDVSANLDVLRNRAKKLGEDAADLRDLLSALETHAPSAPARKPAAPVKTAAKRPKSTPKATNSAALAALRPLGAREIGAMVQPVAGKVLVAFGDKKRIGGRSEGITFVTRKDAQVVAPVDGVIEWAGEFRSYGHMLILKTSDNYLVTLSGMSNTFGSLGQSVSAGEPVGRMTSRPSPPPELYLELRKSNRSENPAGWLGRK